ncbi:MAG: Glutamate racemase [Nitrosopumilales archaeon]|nr:MAG: Glutamate racemase [Nitrosopumilales archaeon]
MVKIAVFDSGFGSLPIIRAIQKTTKSEIIYFADQKNFPYGKKTKSQLYTIVKQTIDLLKNKFNPDLIIVGSNTPTLLLDKVFTSNIIGVLPPLKEASKISKTKNIAILATKTATKSKELSNYIKKNQLSVKTNVIKVNASPLVELVESGKFITNKKLCRKIIKQTLHNIFFQNNIDVVTLSSTHLPLLKSILQVEFPRITFLDPAQEVANKVKKLTIKKRSKKNSLKIFTSGNTQTFQRQLRKIGIKNKINFLSLS